MEPRRLDDEDDGSVHTYASATRDLLNSDGYGDDASGGRGGAVEKRNPNYGHGETGGC